MRRALGLHAVGTALHARRRCRHARRRRSGLPLVSARRSAHGRRQRLGAGRAARAQRGRQARPAGHRLPDRRHAGAARGTAGCRRAGWMVFVNLDDEYPPQRSPAEPLLYMHTPELAGTIVGNRPYYEFRPGRRSTNGTTVFCDVRGARGGAGRHRELYGPAARRSARRRRPAPALRGVDISRRLTSSRSSDGRRRSSGQPPAAAGASV